MDQTVYKTLLQAIYTLYGHQYSPADKNEADKYLTQFINHPQAFDYAKFIIENAIPGIYLILINRTHK